MSIFPVRSLNPPRFHLICPVPDGAPPPPASARRTSSLATSTRSPSADRCHDEYANTDTDTVGGVTSPLGCSPHRACRASSSSTEPGSRRHEVGSPSRPTRASAGAPSAKSEQQISTCAQVRRCEEAPSSTERSAERVRPHPGIGPASVWRRRRLRLARRRLLEKRAPRQGEAQARRLHAMPRTCPRRVLH